MFEVRARYTGLSLSFVLATVAGGAGGVAALIAQQLVVGLDTTKLALYLSGLIVLGLIAVALAGRFLRFTQNEAVTATQ